METKSKQMEEQEICVACGFCCDGTIFRFANLVEGERGHLPEAMDRQSYSDSSGDHFMLPCPYFEGKCSIYSSKKAYVCSAYRCQLLRDFAAGSMTKQEALTIVRDAMAMRARVWDMFNALSGTTENRPFRDILAMIDKPLGEADNGSQDLLVALCNIFETLLIKNFRSADDFGRMVVND